MTQWPTGKNITIAMRATGQPERDAVLELVCGMTDSDFSRHLLHAAYRGDNQSAIKSLDTPTGVKRFVFNVPGSLGFIRSDEADASVKVVTLTGDSPKSAAFGLALQVK
jgi:hypothetical protein